MGCGKAISFVADPIGHALGLEGWGDSLTLQVWRLGDSLGNDWRTVKHWLVPDMRRDRELTTNSGITSRRLIYGRARVGIQLAYICSSGKKNEKLHVIGIFCGHPIDAFEQIWLDDKLVTDAVFKKYVKYELFDGTQTAACASMITASGGIWTPGHILKGCAYIYAQFTYNETAFPRGLPSIKGVIRGRKVYDPRTGVTAWSDNPALCARDYMQLPNEYGGMGCDADEMPSDAEIITRANYCDQIVL